MVTRHVALGSAFGVEFRTRFAIPEGGKLSASRAATLNRSASGVTTLGADGPSLHVTKDPDRWHPRVGGFPQVETRMTSNPSAP